MVTPRKRHVCIREGCGKECSGFDRSYCSDECRKLVLAARARARRQRKVPPKKKCVVCGTEFSPSGSVVTCSPECRAAHDREARRLRNAEYHETVRKAGTSGVKTYAEWATEGDHRAELAAKAKQRRESNPEKVREINRASRRRHRDEANQRTADWKRKNPDRVKAHHRANYERHPETHAKAALNRKLRMRAAGDDFDRVRDLYELSVRHGTLCGYCERALLGKGDRHLDHVIPVKLGGPNTLENTVLACAKCNHEKSDRDPVEWLQATGRAARFAERFPEAWGHLQNWKTSLEFAPFPPRHYLTIEETARLLGVSERTVRRRVAATAFPHQRIGRGPSARLCFLVEDIERIVGVKAVWDRSIREWVPAGSPAPTRVVRATRRCAG